MKIYHIGKVFIKTSSGNFLIPTVTEGTTIPEPELRWKTSGIEKFFYLSFIRFLMTSHSAAVTKTSPGSHVIQI